MKTIYITLSFFAILFVFFLFMYFVDIPSPNKNIIENYSLEIK